MYGAAIVVPALLLSPNTGTALTEKEIGSPVPIVSRLNIIMRPNEKVCVSPSSSACAYGLKVMVPVFNEIDNFSLP